MNDKILDLISCRIDIGRVKYKDEIDINDGRDWEIEALEEVLDCAVYCAARILQIKEKRKDEKLFSKDY